MNLRHTPLIVSLLLAGCSSSIGPGAALSVTGSYLFSEYTTATVSDASPTGSATVTATDETHVSILVKGTSGKTKISYSYANVLVDGPGPDAYTLLYKGKAIGEAGNDGLNRYLTLTPANGVLLRSVEY